MKTQCSKCFKVPKEPTATVDIDKILEKLENHKKDLVEKGTLDQIMMANPSSPRFFDYVRNAALSLKSSDFSLFYDSMLKVMITNDDERYFSSFFVALSNHAFVEFCLRKNIIANLPASPLSISIVAAIVIDQPAAFDQNAQFWLLQFKNHKDDVMFIFSHYLKHISHDYVNIGALLDASADFVDSSAGIFYVSALSFALMTFPAIQNRNLLKSTLLKFTMSPISTVSVAAFSAIAHLPDLCLSVEQLEFASTNPQNAGPISVLLSKMISKVPHCTQLVRVLLNISKFCQEGSLVLMAAADESVEIGEILSEDETWMGKGLPSEYETLKVVLILMKGIENRKRLQTNRSFPKLLIYLITSSDDYLIGSVCLFIEKCQIAGTLFGLLKEKDFIKILGNTIRKVKDRNIFCSLSLIIKILSENGESNDFALLVQPLLSALQSFPECGGAIIIALASLSNHKNVIKVMKMYKVKKYFELIQTLPQFNQIANAALSHFI
jgi:hypothetical protein